MYSCRSAATAAEAAVAGAERCVVKMTCGGGCASIRAGSRRRGDDDGDRVLMVVLVQLRCMSARGDRRILAVGEDCGGVFGA